jgi:hypothetical protein
MGDTGGKNSADKLACISADKFFETYERMHYTCWLIFCLFYYTLCHIRFGYEKISSLVIIFSECAILI